MQIDWLTVVAQIVNFLVLVWLLKRFLYGPVLRVMAEREQHVAQRVEQAERREAQAQAERTAYQSRQAELEREHEDVLKQARDEARAQRQALLDKAREEVAAHRTRWHAELARDREDLLKALRRQVAESAVVVARRALANISDADLDVRAVQAFLRNLEQLSEDERAALARGRGPAEVRTAFPLDDDLRGQLVHAVEQILGGRRPVRFRHDAALLQGIELTSDGRRLSWSIDGFLDDVQRELDAALKEAAERG